MNTRTISIVVPVFNEEKNIPLSYAAVKAVFAKLPHYEFALMYVDDGSSDSSSAVLEKLAQTDTRVSFVEFSRNFGKEMATTAGLDAATGDAVIMCDADLQHPPKIIPQLIAKWEEGAEVVVGMRIANSGEGFIKRWGSHIFHRIMAHISEVELEQGETDFRLMDRSVVDAFKNLKEGRRVTRGIINWLGFRRATVEFEAPARLHGTARYTTVKLIRLAMQSFVSNSLLPLRLAGYFGVFTIIFSGALGAVVLVERYWLNDAFHWNISGPAQLAILLLFLVGFVLCALGLIALYIENIHLEVLNRPLYIVRTPKKSTIINL